ncbi:hypothetical protein [Clostridium kluyveri]|uniref:Uncharacterized protein n=1 Tax=Clostridium kluyveri TaxID=1534 RepID=A0A1L5F9Y2_CLOKL|nr:hypothetical protein [Clostridium kluyveri]APM39828.1 hypothetical protein BS101_14330 [Clostridium kluyveri]UZQ50014.1 hypothetical protein OP486_19020 [Clostridium kluyveri]
MDKLTIESYYEYANKELDFNELGKFDLMDEKQLDLKLLNLIDYINSKFDSKDLYLYRKVEIHGILKSLEEIKIYFNNKLVLCKGKEKMIDYSHFMTFVATGISILVTMAFILIRDNKNNIISFIICVYMILFISGFLNYVVSKLKEKSLNKIRIECGFYELVLNILNDKIKK